MNKWDYIEHFYAENKSRILAEPANEWAIDPYSWTPFIQLTPIEEWLWGDIRAANAVFYPQYPVGGFFVDFANPVAQVAIECDGAAYHQDKAKDAARDEKLANLGWHVYRISGSQCRTECDEETGESGYARRFIDIVSEYHGLIRNRKARSMAGGFASCLPLLEHLMAVNA
jgi:hypothetical protein